MEVRITMEGSVAVVSLTGELIATTAQDFDEQTAGLADQSPTTVIMDLTPLTYLDSTGLGSIIRLGRELSKKDIHIIFANPADVVGRIFTLTHLDRVYDITATVEEARSMAGLV